MRLGVLNSSGWQGTGVSACRWRDRKARRAHEAGGRGQACRVLSPPKRHPGSLPAWLFSRLWGKQRLYACRGKAGKMNQNSRKGNFLFCNTTNGTHATCPPRSVCMRKQKFHGSVGTCEPIAMCGKAVTASDSLCLLLSCCSGSQDKRRQPANNLLAGGRHLLKFII